MCRSEPRVDGEPALPIVRLHRHCDEFLRGPCVPHGERDGVRYFFELIRFSVLRWLVGASPHTPGIFSLFANSMTAGEERLGHSLEACPAVEAGRRPLPAISPERHRPAPLGRIDLRPASTPAPAGSPRCGEGRSAAAWGDIALMRVSPDSSVMLLAPSGKCRGLGQSPKVGDVLMPQAR